MTSNQGIVKIFILIALSSVTLSEDCDGWDLKLGNKCLKLEDSQTLDYESSKTLCNNLSAKATVVTIDSDQEQQSLSEFLFTNRSVVENVWIGAKKVNNRTFVWDTDYPQMSYTNWDDKNQMKQNYDCVEMESELNGKTGKWMSVPCKKRNVVLCQVKIDSDITNNTELEKRFNNLNQQVMQFMTEMNKFRTMVNEFMSTSDLNLIPKGFIYLQLSQQSDPQVLWPKFEWKDISNNYDSLFFRVLGKLTKQFGANQESSSSVISGIEEAQRADCKPSLNSFKADQWTDWIVSGGADNSRPSSCLRFKSSSDEFRPMNTAIKVWVRVK